MIAVEGTILAFGFFKKYDLSLLLIEGRVLDRCRAFHRLASVDAHLCPQSAEIQTEGTTCQADTLTHTLRDEAES
jgi:hypothetical protein